MPLPEHFTINNVPMRDLGISELAIEINNRAVSLVQLTLPQAPKESTVLEPGTEVVLVADDFTFHGMVDQRPWRAQGGSRGYSVRIVDGWWVLDGTTIVGDKDLSAAAIAQNTRVFIGGQWATKTRRENDDSTFELNLMTPDEWIAKVVEDLAGFTVAGHPPTQIIPPGQGDGLKISAAIGQILKWFPGTVATVGGQDQVLTINRPSAMATYTVPYTNKLTSIAVTPRADLVLSGVRIFLRKMRRSNLAEVEDVVESTAGTATGPQALVTSIDLLPENHSLTAADMGLVKIEANTIAFWERIAPGLTAKHTDFADATVLESAVLKEDAALDYAIVRGSLPEEFKDGCDGPFFELAKIVSVGNSIAAKIGKVNCKAIFGLPGGATVRAEVDLPATDLDALFAEGDARATTRYVREDMDARDTGEAFASFAGIAPAIYAEAATLQHEGSASWHVEKLPTLAASPWGKRINFSGSPWNAIAAPVHRLRMKVSGSIREITAEFGFDPYLAVPDRVALERFLNGWQRPVSKQRDKDGTAPANPSPPTPDSNPTIAPPADQAISVGPLECVAWDNTHVRIGASNFNGQPIDGFAENDNESPYLIAAGTGGQWWLRIDVASDGTLTCSTGTGTLPDNTDTTRYELICSWTVETVGSVNKITTHNNRLGPVEAVACRDWYSAEPSWTITVGYSGGGGA